MNNKIQEYSQKLFEDIKNIDENGVEFWYARELQKVLEYIEWRNFLKIIKKAKISCDSSKNAISEHFVEVNKTIKMPKGATKEIEDFNLTRYACYLIVQNGNPKKKPIALGQTYFAVQTRKQELTEQEYLSLDEYEKRLYNRLQTKIHNKKLFVLADKSGVKNYGKFNNAGYLGLYKETASQIKKRKKLDKNEDILDYMGSTELGANIFRITQTEDILSKGHISTEDKACKTHKEVGQKVRKAIKDIGGTMPEDLPTPKESIKKIEKSFLFNKELSNNI